MPRKFILSWDRANKSWLKNYQGKRHYLGRGTGKYDVAAYQSALKAWEVLKERIDAGELYEDPARQLSRRNTKRLLETWGTDSAEFPKDSLAWCAQHFMADLWSRVENNDVSPGYHKTSKWGMSVFVMQFVGPKAILGHIDNAKSGLTQERLKGFRKWLDRQMSEGKWTASTCNGVLTAVRQFCKYCDDHGFIKEMPRGWRRHLKRFGSSKGGRSTLADKHIPQLEMLHEVFNWYAEQTVNEQDWRALEMLTFFTLMLNIGGTAIDIGYITVDEWDDAERTQRLTIERTKTGVSGTFLMWPATIQLVNMVKASTWGLKPLELYSRYHDRHVELLMQTPRGNALAFSNTKKLPGERVYTAGTGNSIIARWTKDKKSIFSHRDPLPKFTPKHLRKMGADYIARIKDIDNRLELVRLYLRHSHRTVAALHYHDRHSSILDPVLERLYADLELGKILEPLLLEIEKKPLTRPGRKSRQRWKEKEITNG